MRPLDISVIDKNDDDSSVPRKRGRPKKAQAAAIEAQLLSTAQRLFLTVGYADTSMDAIAAAAGASKTTLYSRYPDKALLFRAVVTQILTQNVPERTDDEQLFGSGSIAEQMMRFGKMFTAGMLTSQASAIDRLIMSESERFPEIALEFHHQAYVRAVKRLAARIDLEGRRGGWPVADATSVATHFLSGLIGWVRREGRIRRLTAEDCAQYVARSVALLNGGRSAW